jgi:hypothetical protein
MMSYVFWAFLTYLPTLYYIGLFSKIRCSLTYLPTQKSDVIYECSLTKTFDILPEIIIEYKILA